MDFMKKLREQWKQEMIDAGFISADEELSESEIQKKYQEFSRQKMKGAMAGMGLDFGRMVEKAKAEKEKRKKARMEKKKKEREAAAKKKKKRPVIGGEKRKLFLDVLDDLLEVKDQMDEIGTQNREFFFDYITSTTPDFAQEIEELREKLASKDAAKDTEKRMKKIRKRMENLLDNEPSGLPISEDIKKKYGDLIDSFESQKDSLDSLHSKLMEHDQTMMELTKQEEV